MEKKVEKESFSAIFVLMIVLAICALLLFVHFTSALASAIYNQPIRCNWYGIFFLCEGQGAMFGTHLQSTILLNILWAFLIIAIAIFFIVLFDASVEFKKADIEVEEKIDDDLTREARASTETISEGSGESSYSGDSSGSETVESPSDDERL